ncbi:ELWxxDGT repeat protein [Hyalangium gracile]|uniref:ELWxxDGT repeat protein n=1 Tax=Hyalangium gracile TaxID=394092 RepID=UPI001CCDEBC7|nr:ELWxxDGT repeat protein [Hyalangium gracile]
MGLRRLAAHLLLLLSVLGMSLPARAQVSGGMGTVPGEPCATPVVVLDTQQGLPVPSPSRLVDVAGTLFFIVNEGANGRALWKSTGTPAGASRVKGYPSWQSSASLDRFTAVGNLLFFTVTTSVGSTELWRSDGTATGTIPLKSFPTAGLGPQSEFVAVGNLLFFSAADSASDYELWKSDGAPSGTQLVRNIRPGTTGSFPSSLTALNGRVFFAADDGVSGDELWTSDGTQPGTVQVVNIRADPMGSLPSSLRAMGGMLYFTATDGTTSTLWKSDGTATGTRRVAPTALSGAQSVPQDLTVAGSQLFFRLSDATNAEEVWRTDGSEQGTYLLKDIKPGNFGSVPQQLTAVGEQLFFIANDGVHGDELWRSDGSRTGTTLVRDFIPGSDGLIAAKLAAGPGVLLAQINDGISGSELWKIDEVGVARLTDIGPQAASSNPRDMTSSGSRLFFAATHPTLGEVLFSLPLNEVDCFAPVITCPGTQEVEAINPQGAFFSSPPALVFDDAVAVPTVSSSPALWGFFALGTTPVTITATDAAGNSKTCTFQINVQDRTPPVLVCPQAVVQEATGPSGTLANYFVVASDAAASNLTVSYSQPPGSVFPLGTTMIDVVASDGARTTECHFPLTVRDTVPPRLTCPRDIVFPAQSAEPVPVNYQYTVEDVGTPNPELITEHPPGSLFPVGETRVTLEVRDMAGHSAECSFWVKNIDAEPPSITCPGSQQATASKPEGAVVRFPEATAKDNLIETTIRYSHEPGSTFPVGETIVTATATDAGQQTASCTFTVTVQEQLRRDGGCQAGASGGALGWLLLVLVPVWARRRAARVAE